MSCCAAAQASVTRDNLMNYTFDATNAEGETQTVRLGDIAALSEADSVPSIRRENGQRTMSVTAGVDDAHNIGLVSRDVQQKLDGYTPPAGCTIDTGGRERKHQQRHAGPCKNASARRCLYLSDHGGAVPKPAFPVHRHVHHSAGLYRRPAGAA